MKAYRYLLTFGLVLICSTASAQILQPKTQTSARKSDGRISAAHRAADQMITAFRADDFKTYLQNMHPAAIEFLGGKDAALTSLRRGKVALDGHVSAYNTSLREPTRVIQGTRNIYTIVPQSVTIQLKNDQTINRNTYLLGVSADDGRNWKFIDGGTQAAEIRKMLPDFPRGERLPNDPKQ